MIAEISGGVHDEPGCFDKSLLSVDDGLGDVAF